MSVGEFVWYLDQGGLTWCEKQWPGYEPPRLQVRLRYELSRHKLGPKQMELGLDQLAEIYPCKVRREGHPFE